MLMIKVTVFMEWFYGLEYGVQADSADYYFNQFI